MGMQILTNDNKPVIIHRYSQLPNGDKYVTFQPEGVFILKVAINKACNGVSTWKAYKPTFNQLVYFNNMTESKKRMLFEC